MEPRLASKERTRTWGTGIQSLEPQSLAPTVRNAKAFNRRVRGERPRRSQGKALTGQGYGAQVSVQRTDANLGTGIQSLEPQSFAATVRNAKAFNRRVRGERPRRSQRKTISRSGVFAA